ncbi:MAG: methyltransferase [Bdellovibrionaceae bacterium]|nr:methyltransferase [Pseudobdellovibrionaceae bacterium]|tara:strand:- start:41080 stop:41733 length:654 start_codon:yes stop_codon:yes gene_type:complete
MSLTVVSTPIGNPEDISKHALQAIEQASLVIGEEKKVTLKFLKSVQLTGRPVELLNEHSDAEDLNFLLEKCKSENVALVSDCGTPGFCDPGADLVNLCHKHNVSVQVAPGASSLMALLALAGLRLDQFLFRGFLPANNEKRNRAWAELKKIKWPIVIMDTPYRLDKTLSELKQNFANQQLVVGYRLTFPDQELFRGSPKAAHTHFEGKKGEFILLVH